MRKKILLALLVLIAGIQFIRPAKNLGSIEGPSFIGTQHPIPVDVQKVLTRACYDCHSNATRYPWYAEVQPVGWWLAYHVSAGRRHLNFSEFGAYPAKRAGKKLEGIGEELREHEMPLKSYTLIHREAVLTEAEQQLLIDWAAGLRQTIRP